MSIADELNSMVDNLETIYGSLKERGAPLPTNKNFANLASTITSIPQPPSGDGTLADLKLAVQTGEPESYYAIGTEFTDTWNSTDAPLILVHYLNDTNNQEYAGANGAILMRKFLSDETIAWGTNILYTSSHAFDYLAGDYYTNTSDTLKNVMSDITIPTAQTSTSFTPQTVKWFLPSYHEIDASPLQYYSSEGSLFDYFEGDAMSKRIGTISDGTAKIYLLRTLYEYGSTKFVCTVSTSGQPQADQFAASETRQRHIRPCCFISR